MHLALSLVYDRFYIAPNNRIILCERANVWFLTHCAFHFAIGKLSLRVPYTLHLGVMNAIISERLRA